MWGIFYPQESTKWNGTLRNKGKTKIIDFFKTILILSLFFMMLRKRNPCLNVRDIWIIPTLLRRSSLC
jgi:hypothetical protein